MKKTLYFLSFFSTLSYFSIVIGNLHAKLDQILIFILFVFLIGGMTFITGKIYIDKAGWILIVLFLLSLTSSIFNAPDKKYSIIQTINIFSVALCYIIIPNILKTYRDIEDFIRVHLRIASVCVFLATLLFIFSYATQISVFGITLIQNESDAFGTYFTMLEPNIFGSFMIVIFSIAFSMYVSGSTIRGIGRIEMLWIFILSLIGIFISFTRGVWLGVLIGAIAFYVINSKNAVKTIRQMIYFSISIFILFYLTGEIWEIGFVKYKINNFFSTAGGTGQGRVIIWTSAIENWIEHGRIFFGTGTYSFASFFNSSGYEARGNAWIGNVYITVLHDTGLVGLFVYLVYYGRLTHITLKNSMYRNLGEYTFIKDLNTGFLMAMVGIGIAFFFTTALTFSYPWILFGLISAFNRINQRELKFSRGQSMNSGTPLPELNTP